MESRYRVSKELAERIVKILHDITGNNVNFMGENGEIIATNQIHRLGSIHEGAKKIMKGEVDYLAITEEQAKKMQGVLPGYNGPIEMDGQRIGCIGITGDPVKVEPLQKLAAIIVTEEIRKEMNRKKEQEVINKIAYKIENASAAIKQISFGAEEIATTSQSMKDIAKIAEDKIRDINKVLDIIKHIVDQTNMLGLNAAIEAARAGECGRGFSIVAREVQKLSKDSLDSLKNINTVMNEIKNSILIITKGVIQNAETTKKQALALEQIETSILDIQNEVKKLIM